MTEPTPRKQRVAKSKPATPATGADAATGSDLPDELERQQAEAKPSLQTDTLTFKPSGQAGRLEPTAQKYPGDLGQMISEAAYYRAEKRGFAPGYEMEDWIAAEIELHARLNDQDKAASIGIGG